MDLFINRYRDTNEDVDQETQENSLLQSLIKKIEERKKEREGKVLRQSDVITLQEPTNDSSHSTNNNISLEQKNIVHEVSISDNNKPEEAFTEKVEKQITKLSHEFKVLGTSEFEKRDKVKRVLPYWLSHPYSISTDLQNLSCAIEEQNWLHPTLKATLSSEGVQHLFPVQKQVVPYILEQHKQPFWPHDICVSAPTGSGKTLSFVLPIIQILMSQIGSHVKALVVLPVQELATQVANVFKKYCGRTGLKVALLSGSIPLRQEQQQIVKFTESLGWTSKADILVCTAGRLVEHLQNTEGFFIKKIKFLVIDEADRIMDHIQNDWLYHLNIHLENRLMMGKNQSLSWRVVAEQIPPPHKLLFSATLSQDPEKLEQWGLFQPKLFSSAPKDIYEDTVEIRKYTTPDELKEEFVTCSAEEKPLVLYHFLVGQKWDKVLCFTNASQSAHRLTVLLNTWGKDKFKVAELSAALDRSTRDIVLKKFTQSEINVLIGTDALARGIDIPDCDYVVSYDPPRHIKTYIHRVGRTGRAGRKGHAVSILLPNQVNLFQELLQSGSRSQIPQIQIQHETLNSLNESYNNALLQMKNVIQQELNDKVNKSIKLKRGFKSAPSRKKQKSLSEHLFNKLYRQ